MSRPPIRLLNIVGDTVTDAWLNIDEGNYVLTFSSGTVLTIPRHPDKASSMLPVGFVDEGDV